MKSIAFLKMVLVAMVLVVLLPAESLACGPLKRLFGRAGRCSPSYTQPYSDPQPFGDQVSPQDDTVRYSSAVYYPVQAEPQPAAATPAPAPASKASAAVSDDTPGVGIPLEERVKSLEREVADLKARLNGIQNPVQRSTVYMSGAAPMYRPVAASPYPPLMIGSPVPVYSAPGVTCINGRCYRN